MKKNIHSLLEFLYIFVVFIILVLLFFSEIIRKIYSSLKYKLKATKYTKPLTQSTDLKHDQRINTG